MSWAIQLPEGQAQLQDGTYLIGRGPGCQIAISNMTVSGQHAELCVQGIRATLRDLGSRNGTAVDGQRLTPHIPAALSNGSTVRLGDVPMVMHTSMAREVRQPSVVQQHARADCVPQEDLAGRISAPERPGGPTYRAPKPNAASRVLQRALGLPAPPESVIRVVTSATFVHITWISAAVMAMALFLPWVDVLLGKANYIQMWRYISGVGDFAQALGANTNTWPIVIPGLAAVAAIAVAVTAFVVPEKSPWAAAGAGMLGLVGAIAVYIAFASAAGIDLTGMLASGFYIFSLASVALLVVGAVGIWSQLSGHGPK